MRKNQKYSQPRQYSKLSWSNQPKDVTINMARHEELADPENLSTRYRKRVDDPRRYNATLLNQPKAKEEAEVRGCHTRPLDCSGREQSITAGYQRRLPLPRVEHHGLKFPTPKLGFAQETKDQASIGDGRNHQPQYTRKRRKKTQNARTKSEEVPYSG